MIRRHTTIAGQPVTLHSHDGVSWATDPADLAAYAERLEAGTRGEWSDGLDEYRRRAGETSRRQRTGRKRDRERHATRAERSEHHSRDLDGMTTEEAARELGVTKQRASTLLKSGVRRIWRQQVTK